MSTAMNFGSKSFQPRPPDKGSFPLDHFGERGGARAVGAAGGARRTWLRVCGSGVADSAAAGPAARGGPPSPPRVGVCVPAA